MVSYTVSTLDLFLIISCMDHRDNLFTCLIVSVSLFLCVSAFLYGWSTWILFWSCHCCVYICQFLSHLQHCIGQWNLKTDGDPLGGGKVYPLRHKNNLHIILNVYCICLLSAVVFSLNSNIVWSQPIKQPAWVRKLWGRHNVALLTLSFQYG